MTLENAASNFCAPKGARNKLVFMNEFCSC